METIQPGKYVAIGYDLYQVNADGSETLVHQVDPEDSEVIIYGVTRGMIVPLEKAINGLGVGAEFDVKISAEEGFGPHDPEQIAELDREIFIVDDKFDEEHIKAGSYVPMMTADGFKINGLVKEVTDKKVIMDFNHPLAGKDVRFKGTILTVRDATAEELNPKHGCGCGCGCEDDGCGDHCGCDDDHCGCGGCH